MKPQYTVIVPLYFFERASELLHKVWCIVGVPDSSAEALTDARPLLARYALTTC